MVRSRRKRGRAKTKPRKKPVTIVTGEYTTSQTLQVTIFCQLHELGTFTLKTLDGKGGSDIVVTGNSVFPIQQYLIPIRKGHKLALYGSCQGFLLNVVPPSPTPS